MGHVLHAWETGGEVQAVMLHPLTISFTDVRPNPRPLFVAWGGVIWGCLIPLAAWAVANIISERYVWLFRFFAGYCLIANGAYCVAAVVQPVGDASTLMRLGIPLWLVSAIGLMMYTAGLYFWIGVGKHFGWRQHGGDVEHHTACTTAALLIAKLDVELAVLKL